MIAQPPTHYVLPEAVPTVLIALAALLSAAAWVALHLYGRRLTRGRYPLAMAAVRVGTGFLTALLVIQWLHRGLTLATNWPLWPIALAAGGGVELLLWFYALERRTVSRRAGLLLAGLRVTLVLLVLGVLTQPVHSLRLREEDTRYLAVLVDDSASMYIADSTLTASEKIRLATLLGVEVPQRPHDFEQVRKTLDSLAKELASLSQTLARLEKLSGDDLREALDSRRKGIVEKLNKMRQTATTLDDDVAEAKSKAPKEATALQATLQDIHTRLDKHLLASLTDAHTMADTDRLDDVAQLRRVLRPLQAATAAAVKIAPMVSAAGEQLDERFFKSMDPQQRAQMEQVVSRSRARLARDVLLHKGEGDTSSLYRSLARRYTLKAMTFASEPTAFKLEDWADDYADSLIDLPTTNPATLDAPRQGTDLAAALREVMTNVPPGKLSGVVLLTEGRHNGPDDPLPLARKLGRLDTPVCTVLLGSRRAPTDAVITNVDVPESVFLKDKVQLRAEVKLSGLAGRTVQVSLRENGKSLDSMSIRVPDGVDDYRTEARFSHEPEKKGLRDYTVRIDPVEGEISGENNSYPATVNVTEDRVHVLLIENRPRWEFRYLKNLFADRDPSVKLQYLLTHPDFIEDEKKRPRIPASVTAKDGQVEATALPENEAEWMKFDVVILGDVNPAVFDEETQKILRKFVTARGGTLVAIAGQYHLPHDYHGSKLAELLPVEFPTPREVARLRGGEGRSVSGLAVPTPEKMFRIALTTAGKRSVVMSQAVKADRNVEIWDSIPELYWRYQLTRAKPSAEVLAYAIPGQRKGEQMVFDRHPWNRPREGARPGVGAPATTRSQSANLDREKELAARRKWESEHALIVSRQVSLGRVLMLGFDRTWRLRHRIGDTYHHKFWGQVIRWATADKLSAGTRHVKIGTDRTRYAPHSPIRVRAKLVDKQFAPVRSDEVYVRIYKDDELHLRKKLQFVEDSAGIYSADLKELSGGTYRAELESPAAVPLLAGEKINKVSCPFSVDPLVPAEQLELGASPDLVSQLASVSGGAVVDAAAAGQLLEKLGEPTEGYEEDRQMVLALYAPGLALIVLVATVEWITRKKVGLP